MKKVWFQIEIVRDVNNNITDRIVRGFSNKQRFSGGYEVAYVEGELENFADWTRMKVSLDGNGDMFIEEDPAKTAIFEKEDDIQLRLRRMDFGRRIIAIISIRNDTKSWTTGQVQQFANDYADINAALLNGSIATAKALITAITPDGTITTQGDKDALLGEINAKESELGY